MSLLIFESHHEKTNALVFDSVRHKPGCAATDDGKWLQISEVEGLCHLCIENKGADQLRGFREADLRLCFRICQNPVFSCRGSFYF